MDGLLKCNVQHVQWDDVVGPELRNDWERWEHKLKGVEVYTYQVVSSLTCLERSQKPAFIISWMPQKKGMASAVTYNW